jgi:cell division septation protein DedD
VQLGAFVQRAYAEDLLRQARARGYDAALVGGPMYRVWVGGALDRSAAERLEASLKADGFETVLKPCSSC